MSSINEYSENQEGSMTNMDQLSSKAVLQPPPIGSMMMSKSQSSQPLKGGGANRFDSQAAKRAETMGDNANTATEFQQRTFTNNNMG